MVLHITRHGQTDAKSDHPPGDPRLTDLGRRQAALLGRRLQEIGFCGEIHSSPYHRTVETAQVIAEATDTVVILAAEMREYVIRENQMASFQGATVGELKRSYPSVTAAPDFPYPWWTSDIETPEVIEARVAPLVGRVSAGDADVLLVGHGASVGGAHRDILRHMNHGQIGWNCFHSSFVIAPDFRVERIMDTSHLPEDAITSNAKTKKEVLEERAG